MTITDNCVQEIKRTFQQAKERENGTVYIHLRSEHFAKHPITADATKDMLHTIEREAEQIPRRDKLKLELSLPHIPCETEAITALADNRILTGLWVSGWNGDEDIISFANALPENSQLTSIEIRDSEIGDAGARALAQLSHITDVSLDNNSIGILGLTALANTTHIIELGLSANEIDDEGAKILARNKHFKGLYLENNNIGDNGAIALAQGTHAKEVTLMQNSIGNAGAVALAQNKRIRELFLDNNKVGDSGALAFLKNRKLECLDLDNNPISPEVRRQVDIWERKREVATDRKEMVADAAANLFRLLKGSKQYA